MAQLASELSGISPTRPNPPLDIRTEYLISPFVDADLAAAQRATSFLRDSVIDQLRGLGKLPSTASQAAARADTALRAGAGALGRVMNELNAAMESTSQLRASVTRLGRLDRDEQRRTTVQISTSLLTARTDLRAAITTLDETSRGLLYGMPPSRASIARARSPQPRTTGTAPVPPSGPANRSQPPAPGSSRGR